VRERKSDRTSNTVWNANGLDLFLLRDRVLAVRRNLVGKRHFYVAHRVLRLRLPELGLCENGTERYCLNAKKKMYGSQKIRSKKNKTFSASRFRKTVKKTSWNSPGVKWQTRIKANVFSRFTRKTCNWDHHEIFRFYLLNFFFFHVSQSIIEKSVIFCHVMTDLGKILFKSITTKHSRIPTKNCTSNKYSNT